MSGLTGSWTRLNLGGAVGAKIPAVRVAGAAPVGGYGEAAGGEGRVVPMPADPTQPPFYANPFYPPARKDPSAHKPPYARWWKMPRGCRTSLRDLAQCRLDGSRRRWWLSIVRVVRIWERRGRYPCVGGCWHLRAFDLICGDGAVRRWRGGRRWVSDMADAGQPSPAKRL